MSKSIIIIGKGYSVTKCNKEFVDSHDEVAIVNSPVYEGYEHLISNHADYLFTNKTGMIYNHQQIKRLGLKKMIFTGRSEQKFQRLNNIVPAEYPSPNLHSITVPIMGKWGANSGILSLLYFLSKKNYNKISLVGFDFYQVGLPPYYFKPKEVHDELKYMWNKEWKGNKINNINLHNEDGSIKYLTDIISDNSEVEFNIITFNDKFKNINIKNLNIIDNE